MKLYSSLSKNVDYLLNELQSDDIASIDVKLNQTNGCLIFAKEIVDKEAIGNLILKPIANFKDKTVDEKTIDHLFLSPEKKQVKTMAELFDAIVTGDTVLIIDGIDVAFTFGLKMFEKRAIAEPPTSTVIKGPREGFVESLPVNISLMRRKLKTEKLKFENVTVGEYSKTPICICYIKGIANESLLKEIRKKLKKIDIDAVLDSSYIAKFMGEHNTSIFKQVGNTEKPDILASKILEGRVAIFVDGSPIAITIPYLLMEDFQSPSDYYGSTFSANLSRNIRLISVLISVLLPAIYVSAELFHLQFIPLSFLLTIVNSIKGLPLSPSYEMFFTLLIFEILNEASVRMPKYVGMVVSIVGGLVLGETAVSAGIISAPTLMIVALSGICLYTVPELEDTFSIIRLLFLIVAGSFGAYGMLVAIIIFMVYVISFENYSTPLMAPFAPLVPKDLKDSFIKGFLVDQKSRPLSFKQKNVRRVKRSSEK